MTTFVCATDEIAAISSDGLPNYFDDQRFGSVGFSRQFIGHAWLLGDHERALKLALADPNPFDRSETKGQKALIREFWGRWPELKARLDRSSARSIVTYLVDHPLDYRGAFARLRHELRTLYFSAFQSHLWNLILAGWLECQTRNDQRVPVELKVGTFPFPRRLEPAQAQILTESLIPLPSARSAIPDGPLGEVAREVISRFGLEWSDLRVKHLKDVFFSKGARAGLRSSPECAVLSSRTSFIADDTASTCLSTCLRASMRPSWSNGSPMSRIERNESGSAVRGQPLPGRQQARGSLVPRRRLRRAEPCRRCHVLPQEPISKAGKCVRRSVAST